MSSFLSKLCLTILKNLSIVFLVKLKVFVFWILLFISEIPYNLLNGLWLLLSISLSSIHFDILGKKLSSLSVDIIISMNEESLG